MKKLIKKINKLLQESPFSEVQKEIQELRNKILNKIGSSSDNSVKKSEGEEPNLKEWSSKLNKHLFLLFMAILANEKEEKNKFNNHNFESKTEEPKAEISTPLIEKEEKLEAINQGHSLDSK